MPLFSLKTTIHKTQIFRTHSLSSIINNTIKFSISSAPLKMQTQKQYLSKKNQNSAHISTYLQKKTQNKSPTKAKNPKNSLPKKMKNNIERKNK